MHPFETQLLEAWPAESWRNWDILLAVSGGADSVALLRGMVALRAAAKGKARIRVAHYNHRLRGQDSDEDEAFVVGLCRRMRLKCEVGRAEAPIADRRRASEAAARKARYGFLLDAAGRLGTRSVLTAHTADDQAETILHRILRGTGLCGLAGIQDSREFEAISLRRPLLAIRRATLRAYLADLKQPFREDRTNADTRYTRNRIRHVLLPLLEKEFNPSVVEALLRLGTMADELNTRLFLEVDRAMGEADVTTVAGPVSLDGGILGEEPLHLICEVFREIWRLKRWPQQAMGFAEWDKLARMVRFELDGAHMFPGAVKAGWKGDRFVLERKKDAPRPSDG